MLWVKKTGQNAHILNPTFDGKQTLLFKNFIKRQETQAEQTKQNQNIFTNPLEPAQGITDLEPVNWADQHI